MAGCFVAPKAAGKAPEEMKIVQGRYRGGEPYTDFLINEGEGAGFAARLEGDTLKLDWQGGTGNLKPRLEQLGKLTQGSTINTIKGYATDNLLKIIEGKVPGKTFDPARWSRGLGEAFGGKWNTTLKQEGGKLWIISERVP